MTPATPNHTPRRFGPFTLDPAAARLLREGEPVALQPKAFALLCALAARPGQLVTKEMLLDEVWRHQTVGDAVVKTAMNQLRLALRDDPARPAYVETVPRRGYRFIASLAAREEPAPARPFVPAPPLLPPIGRAAAVEALRLAGAHALQGQRQLVFVTGEAGVGKTTLIDHFVREAGVVRGGRVARGQCVEQGGSDEPYLPVLDALNGLCRAEPELQPLLRATAPTWLAQMPWLLDEAARAALRQEIQGAGAGRMLRELAALLGALSERRPLLWLLEDLQWSDQPTLQLIEYLAGHRQDARWLLVASLRPDDGQGRATAAADLHARLRLRGLARGVRLDPFTVEQVAEYAAMRHPQAALSPAAAQQLHAQTGGLPLYLATWLDALERQQRASPGALPPEAFADPPARLTRSLAHLIERQWEQLAAPDQALLEAAAVLGVEFWTQPLAAMLERPPMAVRAQLDALVRQGLWLVPVSLERLADGGFDARHAFRHALHRHVLYERMGAATRAELHRRAAAALRAVAPLGLAVGAAELAEHHERSQDLAAAVRSSVEAVRLAVARFALQEAIRLARRALALLERCEGLDPAQRGMLELALQTELGTALAHHRGFAVPERVARLERAAQLCEDLQLGATQGWIDSGLGWLRATQAEYTLAHERTNRIEAAADRFGEPALQVSACHLRGFTLAHQGDYAGAVHQLHDGLALAAELGDRLLGARFPLFDAVVSLLGVVGPQHIALGDIESGLRHGAQAQARAEAIDSPSARMLAAWSAAVVGVALDEPDRVAQALVALKAAVSVHDIGMAEGPAEWYEGWLLGVGRAVSAREALERIRGALARHQGRGMLGGTSQVHCYAAETALNLGDPVAARLEIDAGLDWAERHGEAMLLPELLLLDARCHAAEHDGPRMQQALARALRQAEAQQAAWAALAIHTLRCEQADAGSAERAALADALARVRGGQGTARVRRARAQLRRLA